MEETFKRIPPEDVFITVFKRKPTEEELWMGVPPDFDGNRPSGNNLIDLFAYLIRKYGRMDTSEYARIMQLKTSELRGAILAICGMSAMARMAQPLPSPRSSGADGADGHEHHRDRRQAGFLAALGILQVLPHADEIAALGMAHREKKTGLKPEENLSLLRVISRQYMLKHTPSVQFPPQSSLL